MSRELGRSELLLMPWLPSGTGPGGGQWWVGNRSERWRRAGASVLIDGWPPLPPGRRPRQIEFSRRLAVLEQWRFFLISLLRLRFQALLPLSDMPERPKHGPRCSPGCADCAAIFAWRRELEQRASLERSFDFSGLLSRGKP